MNAKPGRKCQMKKEDITVFENKAHRRLLVNDTILKLVCTFEPLLTTIKTRKMSYYGTHVAIVVYIND